MKVVIAGAGRMAAGVVYDFLTHGAFKELLLVDVNPERLEKLRAWAQQRFPKGPPIRVEVCDLADLGRLAPLVEGYDGFVSAASYRLNEGLTRLAIERKLHMIDLGGNPTVVERQLAHTAGARRSGVTIVPDCGLAPGFVSLLVADGLARLPAADTARIRVGGLPLHPQPPLNYALVFSAEGLINEYLEDAFVIRKGITQTVPALTELETLTFPEPFGVLEAFQTAGGTSTLPLTYGERLKELDYKTIRYPGHCEIIRTLFGLGLASSEPLKTRLGEAVPKEVLIALLEKTLPCDDEDVALIRVETEASDPRAKIVHQLIVESDAEAQLSAMQRATAFPAAIVMQMILRGEARAAGVLPQEQALDPTAFLSELERRGLEMEITT